MWFFFSGNQLFLQLLLMYNESIHLQLKFRSVYFISTVSYILWFFYLEYWKIRNIYHSIIFLHNGFVLFQETQKTMSEKENQYRFFQQNQINLEKSVNSLREKKVSESKEDNKNHNCYKKTWERGEESGQEESFGSMWCRLLLELSNKRHIQMLTCEHV